MRPVLADAIIGTVAMVLFGLVHKVTGFNFAVLFTLFCVCMGGKRGWKGEVIFWHETKCQLFIRPHVEEAVELFQ